ESHLERCAKEAMPDGSEKERDKFKRYWRERIDRERERWDRQGTLPKEGHPIQGIAKGTMDESEGSDFRSRLARLRLEADEADKQTQLTTLKAIHAVLRNEVVDALTQQAFRETFGREIRPADYLKLGLLDDDLTLPSEHTPASGITATVAGLLDLTHSAGDLGNSKEVASDHGAEHVHVDLLLKIVAKKTISIETWARDHKLGRTTVFDWKKARVAGKCLKGKVSDPKIAEIEQAIEKDAQALGLTTRTRSD